LMIENHPKGTEIRYLSLAPKGRNSKAQGEAKRNPGKPS
jgi:hypothetical protein